ncbi:MAG: methyltransferase domain-containing protein [Ignavibacteriaceae bacterium]|nr:methyltransferase domain-containing protein [Ignavibacteriaceae bacterium]
MAEFTDNNYWKLYWEKHKLDNRATVFFEDLVKDFPQNSKLLEIGGFPGKFAAYFKNRLNCDVTILDSYIDSSKINRVEEIYGIEKNSIKYIKAEFLNTKLNEEFDIVCSFGFLEHFIDSKEIIEKHLNCLKKGGTLFITIPNFKSINGIVQKIFHRENYNRHNIQCMDLSLLRGIMKQLEMKEFIVEYYGIPIIWLEKDAGISKNVRYIFEKIINKIIGHLPLQKSKFLAPQIIIFGIK